MARGKGKNWPKLKILAVLKSAHQKFSENALSKLKNSFYEIYNIKPAGHPVILKEENQFVQNSVSRFLSNCYQGSNIHP